MKLKYYLRGLGIGIVVTALLMGIATRDNGAMSDEEIKARAAQLGMVEQRTLADIRDNTPPTQAPEVTQAPEADTSKENEQLPVVTQEPERTAVPEGFEEPSGSQDAEATDAPSVSAEPVATEETNVSQEPESTEAPEVTASPDNTSEPAETQTPSEGENQQPPEETEAPVIVDQGDTVIIRIRPGDSSEVVSKRLAKAGLVDSASEFNQYLLKKKLTKVIDVGTYEIEKGATMKEIAKIITN